jgi:light-regulated signal transduction histidine kinase (bacteriophytochrome)
VEEQTVDKALTKQVVLLQEQYDAALRMATELGEEDVRRLNIRLMLTNKLLAAANADLEAFSYSVAHDLRSPIRQIAGFSKILSEEFGSNLPAEAKRYVDKVVQGAQQMGTLIDSLLHLAQVGRQPLCLELTPMNSLLESALEAVQADCVGRNIEWQIDALASVPCDRGLMKQAFVNLLTNALKYSRGADPAVIHVGQMTLKDEQIFFVRDNGVGFDMQYADKLFGVFHRLHPGSEFEGTGIGLATVERIVRKHGGHIWAEAEPKRGATFYFTVCPDAA